ncbi:helix-turn-helix domain-containing protein [Streptomyces sp. NPDC058001]|uniref:helix-turn-helix domain-containing protein n=1 Tax=Streptomyces sp. NPDC058001 TaxID=3346300 RepID=UPI0036DFD61F
MAQDLASVLRGLKQRSGLSYAELGKRTFTSRSTLHRYCKGANMPPDYDVVVRIAQECGATNAELNELLQLWNAAAESPAGEDPLLPHSPQLNRPPPVRTAHVPSAPCSQGPASASDVRPGLLQRPSFRLALVLAVCLLLLAPESRLPRTPAPAQLPAPVSAPDSPGALWTATPSLVPSTTFGVTINSSTGAMPSFQVGSVRLWDSETRWANIQPRAGEFRWGTLDRLLDGAERIRRPVLFVLGGTPAWAAPNGHKTAYPDNSRTAPPDDLAAWDAFVKALAERYRGRIEAYELWVLANDRRFYSGTVEKLVEMTARANRILKEADPRSLVVCPSMGRLWEPDALPFLRRFADLGGYEHCDIAGIKLYQRHASDPPETMTKALTAVDSSLHRAGVHPPMWSTGTTYDLPLQGSLAPERARNYAVRFFLVGLYGRDVNLRRLYFYNWGSGRLPVVLQAEGGRPTKAARAVEQLQRWLSGALIHGCAHGATAGLPNNVWQCDFSGGPYGATGTGVIRWAESGTAISMAGPRTRALHRLDGDVVTIQPGDPVEITEEPVLISSRRAPIGDDA